jgi:outer membrane cobalamin receptor
MTYTPGEGAESARQRATDARLGAEGELPGPLPLLLAVRFSAEALTGDAIADAQARLAAGATARHDLRFGGADAESARFGLEPALSFDITRRASAASPEIGAWLRTGETSRVFGRAGRAFRIPTFADLHFEAAPGVRANADLQPERVVLDAELGAELGRPVGGGEAAVSLAAWRRDTRRPIVWLASSVAIWSPRNLDRLLAYGLDLDASYARSAASGGSAPAWSVDAGLSWQRSRVGFGTNRNPLPYQPDITARLGAELRRGAGALRVDARYVGSRTTSLAATRRLDGHATIDATLRRGFDVGGVRLDASLAVLNLFDRRYELVELFPEPGRLFALTLDVH